MSLWKELPQKYTILAPMEGVTHEVFRKVIIRAGRPDLFFTEFTNVSSYASEAGRSNALSRLRFSPEEMPIVAQIWGSKPEHFAVTARGLSEIGYTAVDINFGCPDKNVVATGGGSAMIRTPELAVEIIRAVKASGLETSVKTRLGYSFVEEFRDWLPVVLAEKPVALSIHLRTRKEMSKVPAHFEVIPETVKMRNEISPETLLNFNGDIESLSHFETEIVPKFGLAEALDGEKYGVMIGRAVFKNPFCFEKASREHRPAEYVELLRYHLDLYDAEIAKRREFDFAEDEKNPLGSVASERKMPFDVLKRFFKIYVHDFKDASDIRVQLMDCRNTDEARKVLDSINLK